MDNDEMAEQQYYTRLLDPDSKRIYDPTDYDAVRAALYDNTRTAVMQRFPLENDRYQLTVEDVDYSGARDYSLAEQKKAILENRSLSVPLKGRWVLKDRQTNKPVARTGKMILMNVPYMTERGTFIRNGYETGLNYMFRLQPGVYTRVRDNGLFEAHINPAQGSGRQFKLDMNPDSGVFAARVGSRQYKLYPLLKAAGVTDAEMSRSWGRELMEINRKASDVREPEMLISSPVTPGMQKEATEQRAAQYRELLDKMRQNKLDPGATEATLGRPYSKVSPSLLLDTSAKLLALSRGKAEPDYRDSLEFQRIVGPADYLAERIVRDGGGLSRKLLWKATSRGNLDFLTSGELNRHADSIFNESRHGYYIEGSSPFEAIDSSTKISRVGEGGIGSARTAPEETRAVQDTFKGFIDPVRTPESGNVGLDMHLTYGARKGNDGKLYNRFLNTKSGKEEWVDSLTASRAVIATGDFQNSDDRYIPAFVGNKGIKLVPKNSVDYYITDPNRMFSIGSNTVPMKSGIMANRLLMGSKYSSQALPLVSREAPLVRSKRADGGSFEEMIGEKIGARRALQDGVVQSVSRNSIKIRNADGKIQEYQLYDNFPANQKGYIRSIPQVKQGDKVRKGAVLASTNYTDKDGVAALGTNLKTAYLSYKGMNYEDATVISESASKKLTSEHMYKSKLPVRDNITGDKKIYQGLYPGRFTVEQLRKMDDQGLVKTGTVVKKGDPLVLGVRTNEPEPGSLGRRLKTDVTETWDHDYEGVVVDTIRGKNYTTAYIRANAPAQVGDKLALRQGGKGVISAVIPDSRMPTDSKGEPFELLLSPLGLLTRTNPAQLVEAQLGKVAKQTGRPYNLDAFPETNQVKHLREVLKKHNLSDTEIIIDPETGKEIPEVLTGYVFMHKLKHTAEGKESARGTGSYSVDEIPLGGGRGGSKRLGGLQTSAMVGHAAMKTLKDAKIIRGQRNDDFWRDFRLGRTPKPPGSPLVRAKFFEHLRGAGIKVTESNDRINMYAMTDTDAKKMTGGRELQNPRTFNAKTFEPEKGGLFSPDIFGVEGNAWGYIQLDEPLPNPVMKEPLARILNLTQKDYMKVVTGEKTLNDKTGGEAVRDALQKIDVDAEIARSIRDIKQGAASKRDHAVKRYRALVAMKEHDVSPEDFMMTRVPVLPPKFRSVTQADGVNIAADSNYLYKELMAARDDLREGKGKLPDSRLVKARGDVYKAYDALVGLSDPSSEKLQSKDVQGLLRWALGKGSPKAGAYQRRVIGSAVDTSGRSVVTPNPALKLNEVGLPESQAWDVYEPLVVRDLVRKGHPATKAVRMVAERDPAAYSALQNAVESRPVLVNRSPTLHKFGIMAFWPKLTKGRTMQVNPSIVKPYNMDFDGDAVNYHVPISEDAVQEAISKMMPEKNLLSVRDFKVQYKPEYEFVQGLHLATRQKPGEKPVRTFEKKSDVIAAYRRGEIDIDTPVNVLEK